MKLYYPLVPLKINPNIRTLRCTRTGNEIEPDFSRPIGLVGGNPVMIEYDLAEISRQPVVPPFVSSHEPGIWRYSPLLPVLGVDESYAGDVGQTPVLQHTRLGQTLSVNLYIKNEAANPSGSFKDRGLAMGVALGIACGAKRFCLPTQGNAGVAAAMFSARAGIEPALIYMPTQHEGTYYHRSAASYGAEVRFFGENIAAAGGRMRADVAAELASGELVDISTFFEPGRLEGKKTMGLEIAEAFGAELPDYILYPTGGGTGLLGIWKAFRELQALGVMAADQKLPRMVSVQSAACCPIVRAFEAGADDVEGITSEGTVADGLDVPKTIVGPALLRVLRESQGTAVAVDEAKIREHLTLLGTHGVSASYEGAAIMAAASKLRADGTIRARSRVLLLVTAGTPVALGAPKR